ncbi:MAG: VWA domain-containing protein [Actinomycetota bacterium]|nr:VWA domain-containing protein [Actinomycetota bacterium]
MFDMLSRFIVELRAAGLPVSLTEDIDAMEAVRHVPLEDRQAFKHALGATLVKSHSHRKAFDAIFDVYFSPHHFGPRPATDDPEELEQCLERAFVVDDDAAMEAVIRAAAAHAVTRFAGMEEGRPVGARYYLHRTLRHLDLDGRVARLLGSSRHLSGDGLSELEERLLADEHRVRVERLRSEVEGEIRRRLVADRGPEALARTMRVPLPEDVDFMHASAEDLAALRRALHPLTRKLAARLGRRRRHRRRGSLHFRQTVRHSLSYGGVPAELRFRHPHPSKPEILVIADVSGSVASFSRFTLELVHAMSSQFSKVRSFVFVDGIDEVTHFFEDSQDLSEAVRRVNTEADVIWADGHSDYGRALDAFWQRWGGEISARTTVIVLGDARNNYHAAQAWVMAEVAKVARRVYWLNPEPRSYWDTGDSVIDQYAPHCDGTFECRNLKQLARFVDHLS